MKRSASEIVEQLILYFMIFLILREWLMPIMTLTKTGYFSLFLIFVLICLVLLQTEYSDRLMFQS